MTSINTMSEFHVFMLGGKRSKEEMPQVEQERGVSDGKPVVGNLWGRFPWASST